MDWNYIESSWRDPKKKPEAEKRLAMEIAENPYRTTATLLDQCLRQLRGKPSKSPTILVGLLEKHLSGRSVQHPTHEVQEAALNAALSQKNSNVFNKVCQVFRLSDNALDFLPVCRNLALNKKYNEACLLATALKLQEHFTIQDVVVPLFLQDRMQNVENYLKGRPELQVQFLKFLDGLLVDPRKPFTVASSLNVSDVKSEKLYPKTVGKLISRLLKVFDIPPETCPNLCQVRGIGALKYLVTRRFTEGTVDDENWSDLLLGAVGENRELQRELLVLLVSYNEAQEALRWALHFKVERHLWPAVLEDLLISNLHRSSSENVERTPPAPDVPGSGRDQEDEVWELQEMGHLSFRLPRSDIVVAETLHDFLKCISEVQDYDVVALDGEWKPSFGMQQEKLSLLQLAVWDTVFLLDVQALQRVLEQSHWQILIDQVICDPRLKKLSYGFTSDVQQLARIVPTAKTQLQKMDNMFDFAVLYPKFQLHCPDLLRASPCTQGGKGGPQDSRGLSNLTQTILGLPLDKSMQFSDWDKRPLREPQVLYAALDAYCLLQIYEVWDQRARDLGKDFFQLARQAKFSQPPTSSSSPQKGRTQKTDVPLSEQLLTGPYAFDESRPSMSIAELRVVVDTMLQGLGKHLRICGVDTHILDTEDYHDEAAKVAQREGRMILTSGVPYQKLKEHVPAGHCLNVPNGLTSQEQAQIFFRHFNVRLRKEDVFSRCCACNGAQYVEIPCQDLQQMWQRYKRQEWTRPALGPVVQYPGGSVDVARALVQGRVNVRLQQLSPQVFERVTVFFVCANCGKIYWEGSHHGRVMKKLEPLMATQGSEVPSEPPDQSKSPGENVSPGSESSTGEREVLTVQSTSSKSTLPPPPEMFLNSDEDDDCDEDDYMC